MDSDGLTKQWFYLQDTTSNCHMRVGDHCRNHREVLEVLGE
jgi:hypothetical protein